MEISQAGQEEDWLLDSLEKYEDIYMYELQDPTYCLEWTQHGSTVWMVCTSQDDKSEILQLALPERLLAPEKQTLWAKRDFKMINGALVESHVTCIKYLTVSQHVVSADSKARIQLWSSNQQFSDLLQKVDEIKLEDRGQSASVFLDVCSTYPSLLLTGSTGSLQSLQVLDISSRKPVFQLPSSIHDNFLHVASFLDTREESHLLISCSGEGTMEIWDFRSSGMSPIASTEASNTDTTVSGTRCLYSMAVSDTVTQLALLNSTGRLCLHDARKIESPLARCHFNGKDVVFDGISRRFSSGHCKLSPCVKYSPVNSHVLSISGVERGVKVYDTATWSCDTSGPSPLFVHSGHEAETSDAHVLVHSWQPEVQGATILSADSQASLHAWQWKPFKQ